MRVSAAQGWAERHQIAFYVVAIAAGLTLGWLIPSAPTLDVAITPVLSVLLFVTFLGVPFGRIAEAFRDLRFLVTLLILNFAIVPLIVFVLSRFVATDAALLIGVLLVLLTPCVDYVIVFTGLAGGAQDKLLAAAPLLMLLQMLLLPVYLTAFAGQGMLGGIDAAPFIEAFVFLIVVPLLLAAVTQWAARRTSWARGVERVGAASMVPLMVLTLFVVVASQAALVLGNVAALAAVLPIFAGFLVVMALVGIAVARVAKLDVPSARAVTFSGATRNSLVVLPLALALPAEFALAPAVVVAQTLIELIGMVVYVRVIPKLIPAH
ncbi:arsenic resistance protein [Microbacterium marinum]